ncbi:hypothetical protein K7X08_033698 [Anisodus acutangulus]|uniref:Uncharacterized protein n=1 Tax=Anisodus acutangulus TaxID=402998 RepID=A0A9Q1RCD8_9SOLA|nr:hypothetical protein K7X08_033698 [Anisodus acutangulus]
MVTPRLTTKSVPDNSNKNDEAVDIGRAALRTSLNLLSNTIFSKDLTDPFSDSAKELALNIMVEGGKPNLVDYFPFLQKMDPQGIRRRMTLHLMNDLIDERLKERKLGNNANVDVLDALLNSQDNPEEIDSSKLDANEHLRSKKIQELIDYCHMSSKVGEAVDY